MVWASRRPPKAVAVALSAPAPFFSLRHTAAHRFAATHGRASLREKNGASASIALARAFGALLYVSKNPLRYYLDLIRQAKEQLKNKPAAKYYIVFLVRCHILCEDEATDGINGTTDEKSGFSWPHPTTNIIKY